MPSASPRLQLPFLQPAQAQKHVTHNEALQLLDAVVQLRIASFGATLPPAAPAAGEVHDLGPAPAGDWTGQGGRLALWDGTGWQFLQPQDGWLAWDGATLRVRTGAAWAPFVPALQNLPGLGINASSDAQTRLAVSAPGTLLTHEGAGHQLRVNKAAPAQTASLLFQSAFTGHAEMGLAGENDFSVKVSDGTTWLTALRAARATGIVALPQGARVDGPVTGSAVQSSPTDATAGRLLLVGAFGLGGPLPLIGNAAATDGMVAPGLYAYDTAAGSTGGPAGVTRGTLLHSRRGAAAGEAQLLLTEAGSASGVIPGLLWGRARTAGVSNGAWSAWTTGTVQESISNANGRSVRHADLLAHADHLGRGRHGLDLPQAFASATGLAVTACASGASGLAVPRHAAKGAASVAVAALDASGARVAATLDLIAVGRWF